MVATDARSPSTTAASWAWARASVAMADATWPSQVGEVGLGLLEVEAVAGAGAGQLLELLHAQLRQFDL